MPPIPIASLDDPRVAAYRNLKDHELARDGNLFIAEGEHLVRRLLASDFPVDSVFLNHRRVEELAPIVPANVPCYVAPAEVMDGIIGHKFHTGVIAAGRRKPSPPLAPLLTRPTLTLVVCPEIANTANLGSLVRLCAGFGVDAMLLGPRCCEPFFRQAVRVSMGACFTLPLLRSDDLTRDLLALEQANVSRIATVLDPTAQPLAHATRPAKIALLFGNEAQGLDDETLARCDRRVTIPMHLHTDSLNVAIAAGIFLYHFTQFATIAPATPAQSNAPVVQI